VRDAFASEPNAGLEEELEWANTLYLTHSEHKSRGRQRARRKCDGSILRVATRLIELLESRDPPLRLPSWQSPKSYVSEIVTAVEAELAPKEAAAPFDVDFGKKFSDYIGIGRLSAFEWLVGERLQPIFERYFGQPATGRDSIREPDTPYVRFVLEFLATRGIRQANGKPYEAESIATAMSKAKAVTRRTQGGDARRAKRTERNTTCPVKVGRD
jgi:hypothetical protein